ncbi:MAG: glutamate--cysteine ligase [Alphaproteobacteria bacterium]|nr:glutamate--cysteine ligase [Alphaproteobacteria bacterium]
MSAPPGNDPGIPVESKTQLVEYLAAGSKPKALWRIGTEHEKFGFDLKTLKPLPYFGPAGIQAMLAGLERFGWRPHREGNNVIAMTLDNQSITLEPGGQFELSGAPLETVHQTCGEVNGHLKQVKEIAAELGVAFMGAGFQPKWPRADIPVMPKGRYKIMLSYMPKKGQHGLDMMFRTCTVQVNLDYGSEADMVKKFRVGLALQPVATALFANSPFVEGKPTGYLSYRSFAWTDTDSDRCGMLPFVFQDGMGFERYVDYALNVPMYFVYRDGTYIDASGQSFRDFLKGKLPALPGHKPWISDWQDHLTTLFPEVRLKQFLEMRGADGGPWGRLCALPAFWVGLLYSQSSLDAAWELVKGITGEERSRFRVEVPRYGLATRYRKGTLNDLAGQALGLARAGLKERHRLNGSGDDESGFIEELFEIQRTGQAPAQAFLDKFHGPWKGSVDPMFQELMY